MISSTPPLGLFMRPPAPAIYLPASSLALGPRASGDASRIPTFLGSSVGYSLDSTWVDGKRLHLALGNPRSGTAWHCGYTRRDSNGSIQDWDGELTSGSSEENGVQVPTQAQTVVEGSSTVLVSEYKPIPDIDYLQELLAIQQQGPRSIGFFGTRASGTNAAVIRGALRAEKPELLTVILPQSLKMQPPESQELLSKVQNVIEKPQYDHLPLIEASRLCNMDILSKVQQVICFAFHDSKLLMETCQEAKNMRKIVTLFYLD
ncbi:hypothetical protein MUK42_27187 [Musa troglodytarum]|uniref:Uncharacterized protein n=2 Tax=Musa troglodytarum TaxID=320322 RepID=A0A9E7EWP4_9LILI|nr:hypothetical protein MUK42_27187 [Musa troglodytarum]